jgi:hypothetical protein
VIFLVLLVFKFAFELAKGRILPLQEPPHSPQEASELLKQPPSGH